MLLCKSSKIKSNLCTKQTFIISNCTYHFINKHISKLSDKKIRPIGEKINNFGSNYCDTLWSILNVKGEYVFPLLEA